MLHLSLQKIYFDAIKEGSKTIEGRVNSEKFHQLTKGEKILFITANEHTALECTVMSHHVYSSFKDMLQGEGFKNVLPNASSLDEAIQIFENFPNYKEKVKMMGALAIRLHYHNTIDTPNNQSI